jgi:uncharacterized coiled-coil protein SlyX
MKMKWIAEFDAQQAAQTKVIEALKGEISKAQTRAVTLQETLRVEQKERVQEREEAAKTQSTSPVGQLKRSLEAR